MTFENIMAYAALAGVVLVIAGAVLLALFPRWRGFQLQGLDEKAEAGPIDRIVGALIDAFTSFLTIVKDMLSGRAGKYHPGQVLVAVGFTLFLACGLLWLGANLAGGSSGNGGGGTGTD